ncbi:transmembrane protease serine 12-like [Erythrolamprus reginae]|uniref:transmembrane protease serine 12-like n=1 Tax=Erythrolamprus reginae TaxID=121349 RepID=UPI00396CCA1D
MSRNFCPAAFSFWSLLVLFREASLKAPPSLNVSNVCGERPLMKNSTTQIRIEGGHNAMPGAWPWQINLQVYEAGTGYLPMCGGSLINTIIVLTAAHCFKISEDPALWMVVIALHNLDQDTSHTIRSEIKAIHIHPNFVKETYDNDIAVIILVRSIKFNDYVHPICLPTTNLSINEQSPCYITGWDYISEKGEKNLILQEAQIKIIPRKTCNQLTWYNQSITLNMICAGFPYGGIDSCQGDSGGPLACYLATTEKFYLVGITTFGYGCGRPTYPGVYAKTINYIHWINKYLQSKIVTLELHCLLIFLIVWTVFNIL